jgi:hypothetical protein
MELTFRHMHVTDTAMRMRNAAASITMCFAVMGCETPYGSPGPMGGVTATPLSKDRETVVATGNGNTDASRLEQFALLKAAQDCLAKGYAKFTLDAGPVTSRANRFPESSHPNATIDMYGNSGTTNTNSQTTSGVVHPYTRPAETITVKFYRAGDPAGADGYDAQKVVANLGSVLGR